MLQYSSFNNSVLLTSQAYITSFDIREVQSLAISVRGTSNQFHEEYGLYFNMLKPDRYLVFQDNGVQTPARYQAGEEINVPYFVKPRFKIVDICATNSSSRLCSLPDVAISFERPDFDATFYSSAKPNITSVEIVIGSVNGELTKTVTIYQTGQISVN